MANDAANRNTPMTPVLKSKLLDVDGITVATFRT
jgi:hypothetical protein